MALNDKQKHLIVESFQKVANISDTAAELFYQRLWEIDPSTRSLFKSTDMKEQGRKLMQTLAVAVNSLDNTDGLLPVVEALGKRHIAYGVEARHYESVGEALLWTLEKGLGSSFSAETKIAWASLYTLLATAAMRAYQQGEPHA